MYHLYLHNLIPDTLIQIPDTPIQNFRKTYLNQLAICYFWLATIYVTPISS